MEEATSRSNNIHQIQLQQTQQSSSNASGPVGISQYEDDTKAVDRDNMSVLAVANSFNESRGETVYSTEAFQTDRHSNVLRMLGFLSLACAIVAFIMVTLACLTYTEGLVFKSELSKRHYIVQAAGYVAYIHAITSYRLYAIHINTRKIIHVISHTCCLCLFISGVIIRVTAKNQDANAKKLYEPNMFTLHSMIAIFSLGLYLCQYAVSAVSFTRGRRMRGAKSFFTRMHKEIGIFLLAAFTAVIACGIQQLFTRSACMPPLKDAPDTNPAYGYLSMGEGCRLLNGAGLLVYVASFIGSLAIANLRVESFRNNNERAIEDSRGNEYDDDVV